MTPSDQSTAAADQEPWEPPTFTAQALDALDEARAASPVAIYTSVTFEEIPGDCSCAAFCPGPGC